MNEPLVIGIDSSTQSTKAIAWNRAGVAVAEGRADISMSNPRLDCFEQEPEDCLLYTSPSPRDQRGSRMPSSA